MESHFEKQITLLEQDLTKMGYAVQEAIEKAVQALVKRDKALAKDIVEGDRQIDTYDKQIEDSAFRILLLDQPMGSDFLRVSSALKMITDLERIGDYAVDIAEEIISYPDEPYIKELVDLPEMGACVIAMVQKAVRDFVNQDVASARTLAKDDDKVDFLFIKIKKDLIALIKEKDENAEQAIILMMIAKYFERIGDHAVNIGEWVDYMNTGSHEVS